MDRHYYEVLGLTPAATPDEVEQAWRDLNKVWHPDRFTKEPPRIQHKVEEQLKDINAAHDFLRRNLRGTAAKPPHAGPWPPAAQPLHPKTSTATPPTHQREEKAYPRPEFKPGSFCSRCGLRLGKLHICLNSNKVRLTVLLGLTGMLLLLMRACFIF